MLLRISGYLETCCFCFAAGNLHVGEGVSLGVSRTLELPRDVGDAGFKHSGLHAFGLHLLDEIQELHEKGHLPRMASASENGRWEDKQRQSGLGSC